MATDDGNNSPISQLLSTLGLTREDLQQRSDEMRQFLGSDFTQSSRVSHRGRADSSGSPPLQSLSRSNSVISSSARSASRASSISLRDASPPTTPVKAEPTDSALPQRQMDSMELIIERQRQARKEKRQRKEKERESHRRDSSSRGSPTPSSASSRGSTFDFLARRDDEEVDVKGQKERSPRASTEARNRSPPPLTPQQSKYYREHTVSQSKTIVPKTESPAPTLALTAQQFFPATSTPAPQQSTPYYTLTHSAALAALQVLQANSSAPPVTPQIRRIQTIQTEATIEPSERSPLPPSSPFPNSPQSSPVRPVVNLVSSPGPMGPTPEEESYNKLPYTLPAGPYSPNKPDLSYAALLGRAILSSPDHRLTLQEIYDWITIVYPFFKRGETTWMNSIRHVLSTTACFRKVTRDRALGRTQWAIWDEDLECFKGGGFRKQFCKDMNGSKNDAAASKGKRGRKQEDNEASAERKPKRARKDNSKVTEPDFPRAIVPAPPVFSTRPAPPLQSYQDVSIAQSEVVFPPLPAQSSFRQLIQTAASSFTSRASSHVEDDVVPSSSPASSVMDLPSAVPSSSASTSSAPDLTPNCSSSSPPPSSSEMELDAPIQILDGPLCLAPSATVAGLDSDDEDGTQNVFKSIKLSPVRNWGDSPRLKELARLGGKLNFTIPDNPFDDDDSEDDGPLLNAVKNKNKKSMLGEPFDKLPPSPTSKKGSSRSRRKTALKTRGSRSSMRLSTPPPRVNDDSSTLQISPVRTPLSHRGLHMSPSSSLAHYKSHLDPPPALHFDQAGPSDGAPSTPKKSLVFPLLDDSPFKTGMSPFRTPGTGANFDPHDPRALLDEELFGLGPGKLGSRSPAAGLFGQERQLLYDSPNGLDSSPGKYKRWW